MLAAIFAATMSTVSAGLSALTTATMTDFVMRLEWLPAEVEDATKVSVSRGLTVFYAVCSIGMAFGMAGPSPVCSNNTIY